jgi:hypothetical protein
MVLPRAGRSACPGHRLLARTLGFAPANGTDVQRRKRTLSVRPDNTRPYARAPALVSTSLRANYRGRTMPALARRWCSSSKCWGSGVVEIP